MNRGSGKGQHLKQAWHDWFDICTSKIPLTKAGKFTLAMHFVLEVFDLQLLWFPGEQCKRACESSSLWERSVNKSPFLWDGPVAGDYREVIGVEGDVWGGIPAWGSLTVLSDPSSPSKPSLKLSVGTHSGGHCHGHVVWACLPILPAQKVSFGSCCPSLSSLEDFQQGKKRCFSAGLIFTSQT